MGCENIRVVWVAVCVSCTAAPPDADDEDDVASVAQQRADSRLRPPGARARAHNYNIIFYRSLFILR